MGYDGIFHEIIQRAGGTIMTMGALHIFPYYPILNHYVFPLLTIIFPLIPLFHYPMTMVKPPVDDLSGSLVMSFENSGSELSCDPGDPLDYPTSVTQQLA